MLVPIVASSLAAALGDWFAPVLIVHHPLLEVLLNPRIRYPALASPRLPAAAYYLPAFLRLVLVEPFYYGLAAGTARGCCGASNEGWDG